MTQAIEHHTLLRFPTERREAYRNPALDPSNLPANVTRIRPAPEGPEELHKTPELALIVAILEVLTPAQRRKVSGRLFRTAFWNDDADPAVHRAWFHVGRHL